MMENRTEVIKSAFKLSRAMRRRSPKGEHKYPFPVARTLSVLAENDGATSRELCEILDVRPSSLSELLGRMEEHGLVKREAMEEDKRAAKVLLTEEGKAAAAELRENFEKRVAEFSACFTEEEAAEFCALADKLSAHLTASAPNEEGPCGHHGPHGPFGGPGRGPHMFHGPFRRPF